jgi:uncharacterized lipoprotein YmbA
MLISLFPACGSPPKEHFYTLTASAGSALGALPILDYSVAVGPVLVPDAVDRPQFVLRMPGSEVRIAEQARWAEPLKEGIARAVAANLAHALENGRVSPRAQPATGEPDYRVILDVQRFDSVPGEAATLEVMWTVRGVKSGEQNTGRVRVKEPVTGAGYDALVAAHARALAGVSRGIANAIRSSRQKDLVAAPSGATQ